MISNSLFVDGIEAHLSNCRYEIVLKVAKLGAYMNEAPPDRIVLNF